MAERLQRFLASAGLGSRRACEELIRAGRVTVDGVVADIGAQVEPGIQRVEVDGRPVQSQTREYWLLNKPRGVISTASDPQGRKTVVDCVPAGVRVYPVGRLDRDTTGLLILTNDGDLAHRLLHPRFGVDKEYRVSAEGCLSEREATILREGVRLDDGMTAPAEVDVLRVGEGRTELVMRIHEGRNRQVRRMLEAVGHPVTALHRSRLAGLSDRGLQIGKARRLSLREIESLRREGEDPTE